MAFDYFKLALSRFTDFSGRSRRSEYWYYVLFQIISVIVAWMIDMMLWEFPILYFLAALGFFLPSLAVAIRRLHDTSRSGWWLLIAIVPFIGGLILLYFMVQDSTPGTNQWGPNPKEEGDDLTDNLVDG